MRRQRRPAPYQNQARGPAAAAPRRAMPAAITHHITYREENVPRANRFYPQLNNLIDLMLQINVFRNAPGVTDAYGHVLDIILEFINNQALALEHEFENPQVVVQQNPPP